MKISPSLLARANFLKQTAKEISRATQIAIRLQAVRVPYKPYPLVTFDDASSVAECKTMSDADLGGLSTSTLTYVPSPNRSSSTLSASYAQWSGNISRELPKSSLKLRAAGYAGFRTIDRASNIASQGFINLDAYKFLALRVKADDNKYYVNIQTDSIEPSDIHQHRLYIKQPNQWETILIDMHEFVRTNDGMIVNPQSDMLQDRINCVGISLVDRKPGPFNLCIEKIWATNGLDLEKIMESELGF